MAIAEMKKIALLGLNQDKLRLMKKMQQLGCVELTERADRERQACTAHEKAKLEELNKQIDRLDLSIRRLSPFDKHKMGLLDRRPEAGPDQVASIRASEGEIMAVVDRVEEIERTRGDLRTQEARARAQIEQLGPWENLTVPLEKLGPTRTSALMLASIPLRRFEAFVAGAGGLGAVQMEEVSRAGDMVNLLLAAHRAAQGALDELLKDCEAVRVQFPESQGLVSLQLDTLRGRLARIDEVRGQLGAETSKLAEQLPVMRVLRDLFALERDQLASAMKSEATRCAFLMSGWIPCDQCERVEKQLKKCAPLCEVEFSDPGEDEKPPTAMRNKSAISPFETIVKMFSLPDPNGVDPTFVMMPFWVCFFGMMVSDAGYGIVIGVAAALVYSRLGRRSTIGKMAFILALGGLSTVFWGAMYGGWFSIEGIKPILLSPMDEPLQMVVLCLAFGVVHIFAGIGMAAYANIRRGKFMDAVYDQFSWMMLLIGLGLMFVNAALGGVVAGLGVAIILLMAGRGKKNPIKRLMSGLGALYGISGYVSDILSYARLFGMGLATGVIGMVVNMLALMLWGSPIGKVFTIVVLIFGHTLNLLINALGAYVHSCRLQFIEFFGKFYESGGKDFHPLAANTRYVDIVDGES